jgi:cytochrome P450
LLTGRIDLISLLPQEVFSQEFSEIRVLWQRYLLINNPDAVRHVLVTHADRYVRTPMIRRSFKRVLGDSLITTEGEIWRRHRHIMAPAFTPRSIRRHAPLISQAIATLIERWGELRDGTVVDLVATLRQLTIGLISRAMFSTDCRSEVATVQASVPHYVRGMRPGILDLLADGVASLPVGGPRRMLPGLDLLVRQLAARRPSAGPSSANDLLGLLLAALASGDMTRREVADHAAHILIAGHETTEQTLVWCLHPIRRRAAYLPGRQLRNNGGYAAACRHRTTLSSSFAPGQHVEPMASVTLRPRHGMQMVVERRALRAG